VHQNLSWQVNCRQDNTTLQLYDLVSAMQPLEIDDFLAQLKNDGIRIASKDVIDFLDEQV